jgi:hypothetical protein
VCRRHRLASLAKQLDDRLVSSEDETDELHRHLTGRAPQRVVASGAAALLPGQSAYRRSLGCLGLVLTVSVYRGTRSVEVIPEEEKPRPAWIPRFSVDASKLFFSHIAAELDP